MAVDIIARGMAGSAKQELDKYKNNPDVADIVQTKADLDAYDTSKLSDNDIVKVLDDESRDHMQTYYKWNGSVWSYVGGIGPYYDKKEADEKFALKADDTTPELPTPSDPGVVVPENNELAFTVSQRVTDPETGEISYQSFALTLDDLRNRILSNDSLDGDTTIENAEPGQIVFTEIPDEEEGD